MGIGQVARAGGVLAMSLASTGCNEGEEPRPSNPAKADAAVGTNPLIHSRQKRSEPSVDSEDDEVEPVAAPPLGPFDSELRQRPLAQQRNYILERLLQHRPSKEALSRVRQVIEGSRYAGFGNPAVSVPAMSQDQCAQNWAGAARPAEDPTCPASGMVRLTPGSKVCIDQFEFPNLLCEFPLVWVRTHEAAAICDALGKRLCDAHEWEGACAGEERSPEAEYHYTKLPRGQGAEYRRSRRLLAEHLHNSTRTLQWAYGTSKQPSVCGMGSGKSRECNAASWSQCGTNNYPSGSFPDCRSASGVYDQHGNVAEHMSLPLFPEEVGGQGWTEMKGSWFIAAETHPDDCRWRAKNWHTTRVSDPNSHDNYHLGFRCCAAVK